MLLELLMPPFHFKSLAISFFLNILDNSKMNMKKLLPLLPLLFSFFLHAQTPKDCSVEMWAQVQASPPTVTLNWVSSATTGSYAVARKLKTAGTWSTLAAGLSGTTTQYTDNTINAATHYEYRVIRSGVTGTVNYTGYGYLNAGIEIPLVEYRGKLILLVADIFSVSLAPEIKRLEEDLEGDGWEVIKTFVSQTASVTAVKSIIVNTYTNDPANTKAVFLLGHVPVPYSGELAPDGHPDHVGAWPADTYYGDMDGTWTDVTVSSTPTNPIRIVNVPGDGKFDQSLLPSAIELQVGRVDLWGMTSFSLSETQLLKNYLDKDHDYRKKIFAPVKRALIDDNFGYMGGEVFAASGYKNFGPLVTPSNVAVADYTTTMTGNSYQWSYGCGAGSYVSASGIGSTSDFASANLQGVFTMLFGSYFGDFDIQNNFLRAPLCQGKTLTNAWAGRPQWMFHHMALGENIGYCARLTQNNTNTYFPSPYPLNYGLFNTIYIALMGDPSLRNDIVAPVSNVVATANNNTCNITWTASTETAVLGYNIYMKNDTNKTYVKINPNLISGTAYTTNCLLHAGIYKYMVRAVKLENTPSGTYYNMSEGIADTAFNATGIAVNSLFTYTLNGNSISFTNLSSNAVTFNWVFGNGSGSSSPNPVATYTSNGTYTVTLYASSACDVDSVSQVVTITAVGLNELTLSENFGFFPNPARQHVNIEGKCSDCQVIIYNNEGKEVYHAALSAERSQIDVSRFAKGIYMVKLSNGDNMSTGKRLIIE
jgi:hypothetical protein